MGACDPPPPGGVDLLPDAVEVFRDALDRSDADLARFETWLTAEERVRAGGYAFPRERRRFVASRGLLRALLARLAGGSPVGQEVVVDGLGKPRLAGSCGQGRIRFNVSHSGDLWACAVGFHREVGLDVEELRPERAVESIIKRYFAPAEAAALAALPDAERPAAFHRVWTRKEAWLKARGFGITVPLDSFEVSHGAGEARLLATRPDPAEAARWTLRDLDLGPGFAGCVAAEGAIRTVRMR